MTMKVIRLTTHWSIGEAAAAVEFLDKLREALWETYGEQIIEMYRTDYDDPIRETHPCMWDFDDDIPF